ncbi:MAG TPA: HupE/UreJ family protein [Planctomycetota bacterium]|nr:HupE/UreJ family protein [Planctomycetota bacterium]
MHAAIRVATLAVAAAPVAFAHDGGHVHGFVAGLAHPWLGIDHLLAMAATGAIAMRQSGGARLATPTMFLIGILLGSFAAVPIAGGEAAVALSVVALGVLLASAATAPAGIVMGLALVAGAVHGNVHIAELPPAVGASAWTAGFICASAALHALGALVAVALVRAGAQRGLRWSGGGLAAAGLVLTATRI